jgi:hypothetical protein
MQARINAFEKLFMAGAMNTAVQPSPPMQYPQETPVFMNTAMATPRGPDPQAMLPVSEDYRKLMAAQQVNAGRSYAVPPQPFQANPAIVRQQQIQQQQQQQQRPQQHVQAGNRWANTAPYIGKLMVGSLAGLMILEAVRETEQSNESPQGRGLFALPVQFLMSLINSSHIGVGGYSLSASHLLSTLKLVALVGALLWVFVPSLFAPQPPKSEKQASNATPEPAPSLASPIHVRRQAWLTAIQTVWVPRHNFFLEAAALLLKMLKFTLRNTIGTPGFQVLTGLTEEQEEARVKAWSIALDAQLAGGDVEINKSRLLLTLLASGTLPNTVQRLMIKALHVRVLLWQVDFLPELFNSLAVKLARSYWAEAKQLHRVLDQASALEDEDLPDHLAVLLSQECDEVLSDGIIERAHNLAWNRPTSHNVPDTIDGMNTVVDDNAVRSPMDAVAAWHSSVLLHRILETNLASDKCDVPVDDLDLATSVAPIGSHALTRALVARSVLIDDGRDDNIEASKIAMRPPMNGDPKCLGSSMPMLMSPISPTFSDMDIYMTLRCSEAISCVHKSGEATPTRESLEMINSAAFPPPMANGSGGTMSLLGFAGAFNLMVRLQAHASTREACAHTIEQLAGSLRIWIGGIEGDSCGIDRDVRLKIVERCLAVTKSVVGMDVDQGYASMSDGEDDDNDC